MSRKVKYRDPQGNVHELKKLANEKEKLSQGWSRVDPETPPPLPPAPDDETPTGTDEPDT